MNETITIRPATAGDRDAILRLAELDGRRSPAGDLLLAFVEGELRAALPLAGGAALADPFHRTAALVELLGVRADARRPRTSRRSRTLHSRRHAGVATT